MRAPCSPPTRHWSSSTNRARSSPRPDPPPPIFAISSRLAGGVLTLEALRDRDGAAESMTLQFRGRPPVRIELADGRSGDVYTWFRFLERRSVSRRSRFWDPWIDAC